MELKGKKCEHLKAISEIRKPKVFQCDECVVLGDTWVHLRTCQECGTTLCCDSSPNKHASQHAVSHSHPVIASAEPKEYWMWCYVDKKIVKY
ncbi:UBP-type zinc finger domain-containing protein [Aureisphaera sp.]